MAPLLALSDEKARAQATDSTWPGERHAAIRASKSYSAFAAAATAASPALGRLMAGAALNVQHDLGGYSTRTEDGAWLVNRLLNDGVLLAAAKGRSDREAVHQGVTQALDGLRAALTTGRSQFTAYLGLRGLALQEGLETADLGVAVVRRLQPEEVRAFEAAGHTWSSRGNDLCAVVAGEARWSVTDELPSGTLPNPHTAPLASDLLATLLLLAETRNARHRLRAPHIVWNRTTPYFFQGGGSGGGDNPDLHWRKESPIFDVVVTPAVAEEARRLLPLVSPLLTSAEVAVKRWVSAALVYGKPPEDRLIDAAIAWEALFGSQNHDQLTVQLAFAMAWLLAPDDHVERAKIAKRAKKIYQMRSKLVHGGEVKGRREIEDAAEELLEWLRRAFVAMSTTHSALLPAKTDRARRLMLQDLEGST
ncbi:hypothetical protein ACXIZN_41655 [Amycolatopsis sp. TRM77291]